MDSVYWLLADIVKADLVESASGTGNTVYGNHAYCTLAVLDGFSLQVNYWGSYSSNEIGLNQPKGLKETKSAEINCSLYLDPAMKEASIHIVHSIRIHYNTQAHM